MGASSYDIYLSPPSVDGQEKEALLSAIDGNWITSLGPDVDAFEAELASYTGMAAVTALSSGTSALHLALKLLGVTRGDTVFAQSFTFAASVNPIVYEGAIPVLIDSDEKTWNLSADLLEEALREAAQSNRLPKAIIVVDLYGYPADYTRIIPICERYNVPIIEDATEALGTIHRGRMLGCYGQLSALSFNGNKIITTSGGGALLAHDPALAQRAKFLGAQAKEPAPFYLHKEIGYNYRLSNLLSAVGRAQLRKLEAFISNRRAHAEHYRELLHGLPGVSFFEEPADTRLNRWLTTLLIDPNLSGGVEWNAIRTRLAEHRIESRPLWNPMHRQPVFAECRVVGGAVSDKLFAQGLCLPSGSNLTSNERFRIAELIRSCFDQ